MPAAVEVTKKVDATTSKVSKSVTTTSKETSTVTSKTKSGTIYRIDLGDDGAPEGAKKVIFFFFSNLVQLDLIFY